jgi:hypothetical protein
MQVQNSEFILGQFRPSFRMPPHLKSRQFQDEYVSLCTIQCAKVSLTGSLKTVANDPESDTSPEAESSGKETSGWLKFALLTAASAVAGGLATAWFYRKTLTKLRETGENPQNTHFGRSDEGKTDDPTEEI